MSESSSEATKYKRPTFTYLDIDKLVIPSIRVTAEMPPELEEQFKSTVEKYGVVNPVKVIYDKGQFILVDGLHRVQELKRIGEKKVPAIVVAGTLKQALIENLISGKLQGRGKATDMIRVIRYLHDEEGMSIEDIAAQTGYKAKYLYDLLSVAHAHPDLLDALDKELIGVGHAIEIARIPDPEVMLRVLYTVIYRRMTVKDTKELVNATLELLQKKKERKQQQQRRPPKEFIPVQCQICGEEAPAKEMRTFIACPTCQTAIAYVKAQMRTGKLSLHEEPAGAPEAQQSQAEVEASSGRESE